MTSVLDGALHHQGKETFGSQTPGQNMPNRRSYAATWRIQTKIWQFRLFPNYYGFVVNWLYGWLWICCTANPQQVAVSGVWASSVEHRRRGAAGAVLCTNDGFTDQGKWTALQSTTARTSIARYQRVYSVQFVSLTIATVSNVSNTAAWQLIAYSSGGTRFLSLLGWPAARFTEDLRIILRQLTHSLSS